MTRRNEETASAATQGRFFVALDLFPTSGRVLAEPFAKTEYLVTRSTLLLSTTLGLCFFAALSANAASPQEVLDSKLRAVGTIIDANLSMESVPGAAIGIVHDQDLVWSHQYGVQDLQTRKPVTNDTAFSICSVSKLFTGIAIMDLEEAGKIDLDMPISTYLDGRDGPETGVTVGNVLSHVSGVARESGTDFWLENDFPDDVTLMTDFADRDNWYGPYEHWQYSNLGMAALGQVIATTSGKSFHDYVADNILEPLGMENTSTDMPFNRVGQGFARGYYVRNAKGVRAPVQPHSFKAFAPAAGLASSVSDLARFMSWHFRLRDADEAEVLEPNTLKRMQRVHWTGEDFDEPAWGLAYATRRYGKKTMWGHGGYCPGTVTEVVMRNSEKTGVAVMLSANDVSAGKMAKMVYSMAGDDIKAVYGSETSDKTEVSESAETESSDDKHDFGAYEGHYVRPNYDWAFYVGLTSDGLFAVPVHSDEPQDGLDNLKHVEGDQFKFKRDDGSLGAPVTFLRNDGGEVIEVISAGYKFYRK
ncbi:serine hydrolase [Algimonas ampicilliniresistens]|uniref:serine hydrolase n=1 Tax=Algimonas ampicilliniresistens TaxID=1298735 RepID=UPI0024E18919|nr:serine hydrolase [Algimonas ampicilliniresistens]